MTMFHNSHRIHRRLHAAGAFGFALLLGLCLGAPRARAATAAAPRTEIATFSGGCFWSMNAIFERLKGVRHVTAGFSGGTLPSPSYERVCTGTTGHAETVQIEFDPTVISYGDLLHVFFSLHDPTTPNRQGADVGEQYRSVIFWHTPEQRTAATRVIAELTRAHAFKAPIVTQLSPYKEFYAAEAYHQDYYTRHPDLPYNRFVIAPKLAKLHKLYAERLKPGM